MSLTRSFQMLLAGLALAYGLQTACEAGVRLVPIRHAMPVSGARIAVSPWLNPQPEPPGPVISKRFLKPFEIRGLNPQPEPPVWLKK